MAGTGAVRPEGLRVLYLTASACGDLRVDEEVRRVKAAVRSAVHRDVVHIEHQPAATLEDLLDGLTRVVPHVVSFSGHASEDLVVFDTGADVRGPGHRLAAEVFARAIGAVDDPPRLVVLNACRSQAQLKALVRVVPLAVGMQGSIGDPAAIAFAARFYAALTDGQSVRGAYQLAKVALAAASRTLSDADLPILQHAPSVDPGEEILVCLNGVGFDARPTGFGPSSPSLREGAIGEVTGGASAMDVLMQRIKRLYRENGEPSAHDIARRTGHAVRNTTVAEILQGNRAPRWELLEPVVTALYGDRQEFLRLWMAVRDDEERAANEDAQQAADDATWTQQLRVGQGQGDAPSGEAPQGFFGVSSVDYFCYVSHSKVERMHATMTATLAHGTEPVHPGVEALFRDGGTFGRPHLLHGGSLDRPQLMRRLRQVLAGLAEQGAITELEEEEPPYDARYLHYAGVFQSQPPPGGGTVDPALEVVRLECVSRPGLVLDCSLRYFSEAVDGRYVVSSENRSLLNGIGRLTFDTVFILLHHTAEEIVGSPLYLKLYAGGMDVGL